MKDIIIYKVFLDARVDIDPEGNMAFVKDGNVTELDWNINEDGAPIIYAAAYAVQKEGFDTVKDAYDAYSEQWGDNGQAEFVQPVNVATVEELKAAMANAEPGDIIVLADGEYDLEGSVPFAEGVTLVGGTNTKILYPAGRAVTGSLKDVKISNLTIDAANPFRYCYADGDVVIENCTTVGTTYGIHFDGGTGKVIVKGCEVEGWNSFGRTLESVTFEDCYFTKGNYGCLRFYQDALLKNCTFAEDFSWIDSGCDDISITIEDCTYEKEDGKIYDIIFNYGDFSNVIWTVDDMIVANVGTH